MYSYLPPLQSFSPHKWIKSNLYRGVNYIVLESNGAIIGCAALEKAYSELCYLERLAVLPEKRNKGFGKMLVDHIFSMKQNQLDVRE